MKLCFISIIKILKNFKRTEPWNCQTDCIWSWFLICRKAGKTENNEPLKLWLKEKIYTGLRDKEKRTYPHYIIGKTKEQRRASQPQTWQNVWKKKKKNEKKKTTTIKTEKAKEKKPNWEGNKNIWKRSGTNQNQPDLHDIKEFLLIFFNTKTLWLYSRKIIWIWGDVFWST